MKHVDPTTVLLVPWYERQDFQKLRRMSQAACLPDTYAAWLDNAFRNMRQLLAQGCAVKIVTIHLDEYFAWLANEREADTAAARSRYIQEQSTVGSQLSGPVADAPWPGFPISH